MINSRNKNHLDILKTELPLLMILAAGLILRLDYYLIDRSLWLDELFLALNLQQKGFIDLVSTKLSYYQGAPVAFLAFSKLISKVFSDSEYGLRFIPFACGVLSLFLAKNLFQSRLKTSVSLIALSFMSFSFSLYRYSAEFKQYSSDVLCCLVLIRAGLCIMNKPPSWRKSLSLGLTGGICLLFSYASLFFLIGPTYLLLVRLKNSKTANEILQWMLPLLLWGGSFLIIFFLSLQQVDNRPEFLRYWNFAFLPFPPNSVNELRWMYEAWNHFFVDPGMIRWPLLGNICFFIGIACLYRHQRVLCILLIVPLFTVLMASACRIYPFSGRLLLFYLPALYLIIAVGISGFIRNRFWILKIIGLAIFMSILIPMASQTVSRAVQRDVFLHDVKPVFRYIQDHKKPDDQFYIYYGAEYAYYYYADHYHFDKKNYLLSTRAREDWSQYYVDLKRLDGQGRMWVIFTYVYQVNGHSEEEAMVSYLRRLGKIEDSVRTKDASAYLYVSDSHQ